MARGTHYTPNDYDAENVVSGYDPAKTLMGYGANYPGDGFLSGPPTVVARPIKGAAPGWPGFFAWLAGAHPALYNKVRVSMPDIVGDIESYRSGAMSLSGLAGDSLLTTPVSQWLSSQPAQAATEGMTDGSPQQTTSISGQIVSLIQSLAPTVVSTIQQNKLLNLQVQRAAQGKPPLDLSQYESASQGLNVGINRSTQNTLLIGAALLGGVFLVSRLLKR